MNVFSTVRRYFSENTPFPKAGVKHPVQQEHAILKMIDDSHSTLRRSQPEGYKAWRTVLCR